MNNSKKISADYVVLGAGIYGLYTSQLLLKKGFSVIVIEADFGPFTRASYVNQARVHQGYHYPRSISTGLASAEYFHRFLRDFKGGIKTNFKKIYAISSQYSYTSSAQFIEFCKVCNIPITEIDPSLYFNQGMIDGAYETEEFAFDAEILRDILLEKNGKFDGFQIFYNTFLSTVDVNDKSYILSLNDGKNIKTGGVFSCVYASINQVLNKFGFKPFDIKYEIAEVALCNVDNELKKVGLTIMDGPFFSVMPFGNSGMHSLTSVEYTPHKTCVKNLPLFDCQNINKKCTPQYLENCNTCKARPKTSFKYMHQLSLKYLNKRYKIKHENSLFAIKPILLASETDDSRPTVINKLADLPLFVAVLSGKIDTIYEMDKIVGEL